MTWYVVGAAWFVAATLIGVWAGKRLAQVAARHDHETLATPEPDEDRT